MQKCAVLERDIVSLRLSMQRAVNGFIKDQERFGEMKALLIKADLISLLVLTALLMPFASVASPSDEPDRQVYAEQLRAARIAYFKVITSNDQASDAHAHEALAVLERLYPGDPVAKAYQGSLELLDAAHNWAIWNLHKQATEGLTLLDDAVSQAPDEPEARFIRAATSWHLPAFYHRKAQYEADFALLAGRAEDDVHRGKLPPELGAAACNYWGQILVNRNDRAAARTAFLTAIRIDPKSPGGQDASRRLNQIQ